MKLAKAEGYFVTTLSRSPENAYKLRGLADQVEFQDATTSTSIPGLQGIDAVVSALGAPVTVGSREKRRYRQIDFVGNMNLLSAARAAGVGRFLYLAAHVESSYRHTAYIQAHEEFVQMLQRSGLSNSVVRPTGIFTALGDLVGLARKGLLTVIGDGKARTNPVHQTDVARLLLDSLHSGPAEQSLGGPDTFTRYEIAELAFHVLGKRPRLIHVPAAGFRVGAKLVGLVNPRLGELFDFVASVTTSDGVAPVKGSLRLDDYFLTLAG